MVLPTDEEDALITEAALADPDAQPFTDEEMEAAKLTHSDFDRASFRIDNRQASKTEWQGAVRMRICKKRTSVMPDVPVY